VSGDHKSILEPDPEHAPVIVEIFERYLAGSGFKEITNHLNRPGGPPSPKHVGAQRIHHLRAQHADLGRSIATEDTHENERLREQIADVEHRIELQIRAIEAAIEPALVSTRIDALKHDQQDLQRALAAAERSTAERSTAGRPHTDLDSACEILDQLPLLDNEFAEADPNCAARCSTPSSSPSRSTATSPRYD
jgi:hypothetical protein